MSAYKIEPVIARLEELGWTQARLEDHVGVVRGVASHWKHGRRSPNEDNREKLDAFLNDDSLLLEFDRAKLDDRVREFPSLERPPKGTRHPRTETTTTTVMGRNAAVQAWTLQQANGRCELCRDPAPFVRADGRPYLEVHHVRRLADGGEDVPENTVALCPNCHREAHYGKPSGARRELKMLVRRRALA